jgi:hypothetical protein
MVFIAMRCKCVETAQSLIPSSRVRASLERAPCIIAVKIRVCCGESPYSAQKLPILSSSALITIMIHPTRTVYASVAPTARLKYRKAVIKFRNILDVSGTKSPDFAPQRQIQEAGDLYVATVTGTAGNLSVTQKAKVVVQE